MSKAYMAATRHLDDEYETKQLNPKYGDSKKDEASSERIEDLTKKLPEKDSIKIRCATCEAIVDDMIETCIEQNDGDADVKVIEDAIEPVVEKAIALYIIPASFKNQLPKMISKHLRRRDPMVALHAKAAHYITDAMVRMEEDDCIISEVLDDKPADTGFDIQEETVEPKHTNPVDFWKPRKPKLEEDSTYEKKEDDPGEDVSASEDTPSTTEETLDTEDSPEIKEDTPKEDVQVDADLPKPVEDSMRFLAASAVNHRKATALVSRKLTGVMLTNILYQLRHHLPDFYKKKYGID